MHFKNTSDTFSGITASYNHKYLITWCNVNIPKLHYMYYLNQIFIWKYTDNHHDKTGGKTEIIGLSIKLKCCI